MNRGFYYACNGMIMNQRKLDCIGNNLTNMYTPGYKRDTIITNRFQEQMILVNIRADLCRHFVHRPRAGYFRVHRDSVRCCDKRRRLLQHRGL